MGKFKKNRVKNRTDPTAKPIKPPSDPELAAIREKRILPVIQDLQSAELKKRSAAAKVIAHIIEEKKCRKLLLREQLVRILMEQTLTDSNLEARNAGWGILRNLALEEEADFCVHLYRQDILTAIEGIVRNVSNLETKSLQLPLMGKQINETLQSRPPLSQLPKAQQDLVWDLNSSVINLLTSLSEAQDEIVQAITKRPIIAKFLFGLLLSKIAPVVVQHEVLSCLTALTEDNKDLCEQITIDSEWLDGLIRIKDSGSLKGVAACGVLHNIFSCLQWFDHNTPKEGVSDALLIPTLAESLETASNHADGMNGQDEHSSPDQILQLALEITASIASSLQEALEHGSRFEKEFKGFGDQDKELMDEDKMDADGDDEIDGEDEGDNEEPEEDEEMNEDGIISDMDLVTREGPDEDDASPEEVTLDRLVRLAAPQVLLLAQPTAEDHNVHNFAISALNNIAWIVSSIDFSTGHLDSLNKYWSSLAQQSWNEIISPVLASNTADIELASSITSLAWAICRSTQGTIKIKPEEQCKFMALYQASKSLTTEQTNGDKKGAEDEFQSLGVKSIGVLGRLALHPASIDLNNEIGVFLLTTLSDPSTPAADTVEALNQIFDIYADKSYAFDEPVFWNHGFYKHLEDILPKAKKMAKGIDKRVSAELRARADEAVLNLGRFLRYKRNEKTQKD